MADVDSSFAWLDHSEKERRRMAEIISLFRDRSILDELGVGSIRDWALADLMFPGTSTIQTRARYFLFIPWTYLKLEGQRTPSNQVGDRVRELHVDLVQALFRGGEKDSGVIGAQSGKNLRQLPNSIYWRGMQLFGIRQYNGTIDNYHRSLDSYYRRLDSAPGVEGDERADSSLRPNWDAGIPTPPKKWLRRTNFELSHQEAQYLRDRVSTQASDSLLAFLLRRGKLIGDFKAPWLDPELAEYPRNLRDQLAHAQNFAELMQGALLLYELMLAEVGERDDLRAEQTVELSRWREHIVSRRDSLDTWDLSAFWSLVRASNPRISPATEIFVEDWIRLALENPDGIARNQAARRLIVEREHRLKRRLARLSNPEALKTWTGVSGITLFRYRWPRVQTIVNDIVKGLGKSDSA